MYGTNGICMLFTCALCIYIYVRNGSTSTRSLIFYVHFTSLRALMAEVRSVSRARVTTG
jgi:hypothetical protein